MALNPANGTQWNAIGDVELAGEKFAERRSLIRSEYVDDVASQNARMVPIILVSFKCDLFARDPLSQCIRAVRYPSFR